MRTITLEIGDDVTDEQIEDWKYLAKSNRYVVIKVPAGVSRAQTQSFMSEARKVLSEIAKSGKTLEQIGEDEVRGRNAPKPHVCDVFCHHDVPPRVVHQTKETIQA